jgi:hypothetical protein
MRRRVARRRERICLIKATMSDWGASIRGKPYRVLAVPERLSLHDLAESLVEAFGFDFDHCFGFYDNLKSWVDAKECYEVFKDLEEEEPESMLEPSKSKGVKGTKVSEALNEVGKRMLFLFDYGDEWHFIIQFKGVEPAEKGARYPKVVESVGEAPPQYPNES